MVHITINGHELTVEPGVTVLQAAKQAGIDIPTLCHHPAVSDIGACRVCLVEVAKQRTLQPACTFPVSEGMEVQTESPKVVAARRFVLELLFSERNHYCMYCQMSGDCELQALAYRYGLDHWTYDRPFEPMPVDGSRRYFLLDHNRCVLCRRCIRACEEITANHTLGSRQRGSKTMISADLDVPFGQSTCVSCGTCLQVCPTGALIDRKSAYRGREKSGEVQRAKSVCVACAVGCGVEVVHRAGHVVRIESDWEAEPSRGLLCVAGRFEPLDDVRPRLTRPLVRRNGSLVEADWDSAMEAAVAGFRKARVVAGLATGRATNEALRAVAKAFPLAGTWGRPLPSLGYGRPGTLADIQAADAIVVAGADPAETHRVVAYMIRRALDHGARLFLVDGGGEYLAPFATLSVADAQAAKVVQVAADATSPVVIYGTGLGAAAHKALKALDGKAAFIGLPEAANARGAEAEGVGAWNGTREVDALYVLAGDDPAEPAALPKARFLVVQSAYRSALTDRADVVFPSPAWAERSGHVTNLEGRVCAFDAAYPAPKGVPAEWQPVATLAERLGRT
ncbi:MAG: 2Fe-2S iron-sulfur cluster-binding protein [Anaerolineae bacterium]|nr:2Fe-2S iron-sulfur cluster-binding protein [Anaerolineae bacterium]